MDSPANVDAAKEVRTDFEGAHDDILLLHRFLNVAIRPTGYKKKVRRLVRRSAEEAWD